MRFEQTCLLKDGTTCLLRNLTADDALEAFEHFQVTHGETDFLTSYPDENSFDEGAWRKTLGLAEASARDVQIGAFIDGCLVGTVSVDAVSKRYKCRHRAELGIAVLREAWGLGIGRHLMEAAVACGRIAGFEVLELEVVEGNEAARNLYHSMGFVEFGRYPKAFKSRYTGWQSLIYLYLDLEEPKKSLNA